MRDGELTYRSFLRGALFGTVLYIVWAALHLLVAQAVTELNILEDASTVAAVVVGFGAFLGIGFGLTKRWYESSAWRYYRVWAAYGAVVAVVLLAALYVFGPGWGDTPLGVKPLTISVGVGAATGLWSGFNLRWEGLITRWVLD